MSNKIKDLTNEEMERALEVVKKFVQRLEIIDRNPNMIIPRVNKKLR